MAQVLGIHEIDLGPTADAAEFERLGAAAAAAAAPEGLTIRLLKAERGARLGQYLLVLEFDDLAARDRYFPASETESENLLEYLRQHPDLAQAWDALQSFEPSTDVTTDYQVIAE